jgi:hypothetical protein
MVTMTVIVKNFDKYKIAFHSDYYSLAQNDFGVKNWIQIECYNNQTRVANLLFNNTLTFAKNSYTSGVDVITLIYHIDRFDEIYNLIRREKPLQAVIDDKTLNGNVSTLQLEPVGELDV